MVNVQRSLHVYFLMLKGVEVTGAIKLHRVAYTVNRTTDWRLPGSIFCGF